MADAVRRTEYYYATVPDEPGAGARVLSHLQQARVNLAAYLGFPSGNGQSQIDLVPENAGALKQAAENAGLKLTGPKRAFLIQGDDRVGAVADVARKLAEVKVNITGAAACAAGGGRYGMVVWVSPADYEKAAKALGV
jgi:hypothetical protein